SDKGLFAIHETIHLDKIYRRTALSKSNQYINLLFRESNCTQINIFIHSYFNIGQRRIGISFRVGNIENYIIGVLNNADEFKGSISFSKGGKRIASSNSKHGGFKCIWLYITCTRTCFSYFNSTNHWL